MITNEAFAWVRPETLQSVMRDPTLSNAGHVRRAVSAVLLEAGPSVTAW